MRVAYLVNQYPKVSHTFIRREILALEKLGVVVERISLRASGEELVDAEDQRESERTHIVLSGGVMGLLIPLIWCLTTRPLVFLGAAQLTAQLAGRAPRAWKHLAYLAEAAALTKTYVGDPPAHIHAHFGTNSATVALLWSALSGIPFSFTVHGPEEFDHPESLGLDLKIAQARFVVAISNFGCSQLMRWCPSDQWKKLQVVHCGVDDGFLDPSASSPVPDVRRLVCVGRLCEQKGHGLLVEAAARLAEEGEAFELVLVGDGPLRPQIENLVRDRGLDGHVRITGWRSGPELTREILASRAFVLPSFAEGLPVVLMEALALRRPVISTYVAGIPELVTPGLCGWLVPAGSVNSLCDAIRSALHTPVERLEAMGEMGALRVQQNHSALTEAEKLRALFFPEADAGKVSKADAVGTLRNLNGRHSLRNRKNLPTGN
ncbi:MAG TPA: glycosyltransferase family 4 protein [Planctomycetaceae bacterium]|jgi:colanic acid/amylovoran biosynthesis glycosyltransferase|nr:glycosyltransferase family 4 protein [Planctomycetaceae bacterium]